MKTTMKDLLKSTVISIGAAMAIFCIVCVVFDISNKGSFSLEHYSLTKMVVGCVLIGLGFGVPSVVYSNDNLPMPLRVLVHMGIGCVVYTIVAYAVGWIGGSATFRQGIIIACIQFAVILVIWLLFFSHYRKEAKAMNDRLEEMNK